MHCQRRGHSLNMVLPSGRVRDHHASLFHVLAAGLRMTPELEAKQHRIAALGGPIALLKDGDLITIDAVAGTLTCDIGEAEMADRRKNWQPRETDYRSGALWKYAQGVGDARHGAVTHPGGAAETHCYADI